MKFASDWPIIANLRGGLGNQMFQYALGRAVSLELRRPLMLAIDMLDGVPSHATFQLEDVYSVKCNIASLERLRGVIGPFRAFPNVRRVLAHRAFAAFRGSRFIAESEMQVRPSAIGAVKGGVYLHGYWQSERYFSKYAEEIRSDFTFRRPLTGGNAALAEAICACDAAVSVHVRRGDYLSARAQSVHGVLGLEYYTKAVEVVRSRVPSAKLFVFSDDPEWVSDKFSKRFPGAIIANANSGRDSCFDLQLMALCRHHIIANSSFSWWGAWLRDGVGRVVVAPRRWFAGEHEAAEIVPRTWECI